MNTNSHTSTLPSYNSRLITNEDLKTQSFALIKPEEGMERPTQEQKKSVARVYAEQAWFYFKEQNWDKAIIACKNSLETAPDHVDAYKILGNILQRQGKKPEALGVYAKALTINPNCATIYANLGSFYAEQQKWRQALDYFQQAVILDPQFAGAYRSLAQIWEELGETSQALECFCQAVNLEPETLTAPEYFSFGAELYQQGKVKEASIFYIQGVKLNPQAEAELSKLVKILEELEEWQQAVTYYHQLMTLTESAERPSFDSKPIKRLLSRSKSQAKKTVEHKVIKALSRPAKSSMPQLLPSNDQTAIATDLPDLILDREKPDSAIAWNNLGSLYAQKEEWTKAISCYQAAIQLEPNFPKSYRNLARIYSKLGDRQKASLCWYEAFALEPERVNPDEYFSLAKNLLELGQVDKSVACLRRTIELKPNFKTAHLILGKLLNRRNRK